MLNEYEYVAMCIAARSIVKEMNSLADDCDREAEMLREREDPEERRIEHVKTCADAYRSVAVEVKDIVIRLAIREGVDSSKC